MAGKTREEMISVRLTPELRKQLEKEGITIGLSLAPYLRMLIVTHPDRNAQSPSKAFIQRAFTTGKTK